MAKKDNKKVTKFQSTMKEALMNFSLKDLKTWMQKYNKPLWNSFKKENEATQTMTMCKLIVNRTDMFDTEAYKKATEWLKKHNTKGGMF